MFVQVLRRPALLICLATLLAGGCFPAGGPKELEGPLTEVDANKAFTAMRREHGPRYTADLEWNGKKFVANWELGTLMERKQQLQIKPKKEDFTIAELCMCLEVAIDDYDHCPWHPVIKDAVLSGFRRSLHSQGSVIASSSDAPPYAMSVWVKDNGSHWFCQVKGHNSFTFE